MANYSDNGINLALYTTEATQPFIAIIQSVPMTNKSPLFLIAAALVACAESTTSPDLALQESQSAASAAAISSAKAAASETIVGLTANNSLITFSSSKPNQTSREVQITGLMSGENVVGIDFRPSDLTGGADIGKLYGLTDDSRVCTINPTTGVASMCVALVDGVGAPVLLTGTSFGVGFNPVVDRLRIHSDSDQNLRVNVESGVTIRDGALMYTAGDPNAGDNPAVTATAYTNNDTTAATGTELYAIDVTQDVLVEFGAPTATTGPNSGQLLTVGSLGVNAGSSAGIDISVTSSIAYAALSTSSSGKSTLYSINLDTGAATKIGLLAQTKGALLSIAVQP